MTTSVHDARLALKRADTKVNEALEALQSAQAAEGVARAHFDETGEAFLDDFVRAQAIAQRAGRLVDVAHVEREKAAADLDKAEVAEARSRFFELRSIIRDFPRRVQSLAMQLVSFDREVSNAVDAFAADFLAYQSNVDEAEVCLSRIGRHENLYPTTMRDVRFAVGVALRLHRRQDGRPSQEWLTEMAESMTEEWEAGMSLLKGGVE